MPTTNYDAVDQLVEKLNEIGGIEFTRDAWENKAPEQYGVVELGGESRQLWADGRLLDSMWTVIITAYVNGDDDTWPAAVQEKLEELEADGLLDLTHTISREYDYGINKVMWKWTAYLAGPLAMTVAASIDESGGE